MLRKSPWISPKAVYTHTFAMCLDEFLIQSPRIEDCFKVWFVYLNASYNRRKHKSCRNLVAWLQVSKLRSERGRKRHCHTRWDRHQSEGLRLQSPLVPRSTGFLLFGETLGQLPCDHVVDCHGVRLSGSNISKSLGCLAKTNETKVKPFIKIKPVPRLWTFTNFPSRGGNKY